MRRRHIELVSSQFSKEEINNMLVFRVVLNCNVDRVIYRAVTNRGNMYIGEKIFIYQGFSSEEKTKQMLNEWVEEHNAKFPYKAFQTIEFMNREVVFSQLNPLSLKYTDGTLFNEYNISFSHNKFDKSEVQKYSTLKQSLEKEMTKIEEIENSCEKQVIFKDLSTKCFVRTIKFSYLTKKNKRKDKIKSFITVDCTESSSQYNQITRDKEILKSCSICSEKELANVKILSSSLSEIGALKIA